MADEMTKALAVIPPSKKEAVGLILDEMKKIINKALDDGHGQDMSPLELIASLTGQLCMEAMKVSVELDALDGPDDTGGLSN